MKMEIKLPKGILERDAKFPSRREFPSALPYEQRQFDLWLVPALGWCIPTLGIRGAGRRSDVAPRTYAIVVSTEKLVRIGLGPHVTRRVTIYVRRSRMAALKPYIALKEKGSVSSNNVRDRISSRRAQTALYRMDRGY